MTLSVPGELWRRVSLSEATTRKVLEAAVAVAHAQSGASWTCALMLLPDHNGHDRAQLVCESDVPAPSALFSLRAAALAPASPSALPLAGEPAVFGVGLFPHGVACAAIIVGLRPGAPSSPILALLESLQQESEVAWDLAEQATDLRARAPTAIELADLRKQILQRLWHELLTPVALLRAAHAQLHALEQDDGKKKALRRIGTAVERLGHLFDLLNDIVWAREAFVSRTEAAELANSLLQHAESNLLVELSAAGMLDETAPLRAAVIRLSEQAQALVPLIDEVAAPLDLTSTIRGAVTALSPASSGRRLEFAIDAPGEERLPPQLFGEALSAILRNAIAGTPDGSSIAVSARRDHLGLTLEVADRGVGIPAQRLAAMLAGLHEARDPTWYSSGKPLAFGAGGAGLDLVRVQALGRWRGWQVEAESKLCPHVEPDGRGCIGDASKCKFLSSASECSTLPKGTVMRIRIP